MICYTGTISDTTHKKVHPCLGDSKYHQSRISNTILKTSKDQTQSSTTGLFIMLPKSVPINVCRKLKNEPCGLSLACFCKLKLTRKIYQSFENFKITHCSESTPKGKQSRADTVPWVGTEELIQSLKVKSIKMQKFVYVNLNSLLLNNIWDLYVNLSFKRPSYTIFALNKISKNL